MSGKWPSVKLGDVLSRSTRMVELHPDREYREVTVKLWGKGVVLRGIVSGAEIAGGRRFAARAGQFILSRIDARNGALGVVPKELDGAVVSNDFPLFDPDPARLDSAFLGWLSRTRDLVELCQRASEGTTNRIRLQEGRFLALEIRLPPIVEQRQIVAWIEGLAAKIAEVRGLCAEEDYTIQRMLLGAFRKVAEDAPRIPLGEIAPLVRRPVRVDLESSYPEIGIRSFGHGTFHKPALSGFEVGGKRLFRIEPGDLLFSNVFAWEGAIAVASSEDAGRFGSHRFITCVPKEGETTARFLCFYFLTNEGLEQIRAASPGGAGRNRTLGLQALSQIEVPTPSIAEQLWFDTLQARVDALKRLRAEIAAELAALMSSILDRALKRSLPL